MHRRLDHLGIATLGLWVFLCGTLAPLSRAASESELIDFDRDIRPILSDRCYHCHGPDTTARKAGLRLDTRDGAFSDLGGYSAFHPSRPDLSEALRRIHSEDPGRQMPPPRTKTSLTDREKALLQQWVEQGAPWSEHWAFVPPTLPEVPKVLDSSGLKNEVDAFVLAALEPMGMALAEPAAKTTLLRRATLDLTGKPPTLAEIDAFLTDESNDAYEQAIERLLESEAYGERMAWEWMEAGRYADTDGFQNDPTRSMWPWRDWVVRALNENMPFDQFTVAMLAGDLLDDPEPEEVLATAFNRNHMHNGEGGRIPEENRIENAFDRTETTATIWLGLTMTCARCHDHKFDPISQREYYGLFAFFNNTSETGRGNNGQMPPLLQYHPIERRERLAELDATIAEYDRALDAEMPKEDARQRRWEGEQRQRWLAGPPPQEAPWGPWSQLGPFPAPNGEGGASFDREDWDVRGDVEVDSTLEGGVLRWEVRNDLRDGVVHELSSVIGSTYLRRTVVVAEPRKVDLSLGSDDGIKVWVNGELVLANKINRGAAADQEKIRIDLTTGENTVVLKIVNTGGLSGFYFKSVGEVVHGLPLDVAKALVDGDAADHGAAASVRRFFREQHSPKWREIRDRRKVLVDEQRALDAQVLPVMVMDDLGDEEPRSTFILNRGLYDHPGESVDPMVPAFLPSIPEDAPKNRLTLAEWLIDDDHPLTARVTVNRAWQMFFGRGLVETSEDFGSQGQRPSHPGLLDWLAVRFVESGWDVKALHRWIVTSATYRQSSIMTENTREQDPDNRFLARGARFRMPSWMIRDQALSVSGLLSPRVGGPPVKPYQPDGIWAEATFGKIRYQRDEGESLYRRSLYVFWRRIVGPTMLFDVGKRQTCEVKPTRTNSPLHALTTLNETLYVESARNLGARAMVECQGRIRDRLAWMFRTVTAREPRDRELEILWERWRSVRIQYAQDPDSAIDLLSMGESERDERLDPVEHAAYAVLASLILNLDEALTRE